VTNERKEDKPVLEEIRMAKSCVADAETDLAGLLKEMEGAPRAAKTTMSEALQGAFQKLRDAREHLGNLETLIDR
jgi:hypothetical protein